MNGMHIDERDGNYMLVFEMAGVREQDIIITCEDNSVHVIASTATITTDAKERRIDLNSVYFDKTIALSEKADFSKMKHVFFLGMLEVTIPKC
ncbi:MAG: Hsp20/alpha crystallin family protein [Candidatus Woesearchaeota archaeon]|nr:Hsp20/alpha crystallin family protein [Candidatus Woesearchaeota archaeon]